jgi:hypothetical protein
VFAKGYLVMVMNKNTLRMVCMSKKYAPQLLQPHRMDNGGEVKMSLRISDAAVQFGPV